jgi:hypothetical protein
VTYTAGSLAVFHRNFYCIVTNDLYRGYRKRKLEPCATTAGTQVKRQTRATFRVPAMPLHASQMLIFEYFAFKYFESSILRAQW